MGHVYIYIYTVHIILSHMYMYMYAVYSTQHWILLPVVVQEHVVKNMES